MRKIYLLDILVMIFFSQILNSCQRKINSNTELNYYEDGRIKSLVVNKDKNQFTEIYFDRRGEIDSIENKQDSVRNGQSLWFNKNGILENSAIFKNGKHNGQAFMFYDNGSLKIHRNWTDGKREGYTTDFYQDSIGTLKNIYFYSKDTVEWWRPAGKHSAGISTSPTFK